MTFFNCFVETANANECNNCYEYPSKSSLVLRRLFVSIHVGQTQLLFIASEMAIALISHPVAAAGFRADFSDRQKFSARMRKACRDQQGRRVT